MLLRTAAAAAATRRAASSTIARGGGSAMLRGTALRSSSAVLEVPTILSQVRQLSAPAHQEEVEMFCRQCEQARDGVGCSTVGVCGKTPETSAIQDAVIHVIKSVSTWCVAARAAGASAEELHEANIWSLQAAFATLTNVNFSESACAEFIHEGMKVKAAVEDIVAAKGGTKPNGSVADLNLSPDLSLKDLEEFGKSVGVLARKDQMGNDDVYSLSEIATAGAKGVSAYAAHCHQLGYMDEDNIMAPLHEVWAKIGANDIDLEGHLANALRVGAINQATLAMLDDAHATKFGVPEPTEVRKTPVEGKAILVSGHDMADLHALLEQTEGKGINVYTHGEMLPAHGYPELRKFKHLAGNYGTAWQMQKLEFATFPGPVIVTTNCILEPNRVYKDRLFTMNEVGVDGVKHIGSDRDYSEVIEKALSTKGFAKTVEPAKYHTVGFNHRAVMPLAGKVIEAAKSGQLSRIFLIGGCDGTEGERNYFTDLAESAPSDSLILTLGCAKNRIIHSEKLHGATLANGLPRVLDMGQCNDSYSAVVVALELAKALDCGVNDLPLSLALSHLEQKAAAVLLTLLNLGVQNIRLGPTLPAFVTPGVLEVLQKNYNLMPTVDAEDDLKLMMDGK